jgi:hypothetical protein
MGPSEDDDKLPNSLMDQMTHSVLNAKDYVSVHDFNFE